LLSRLLLRRDGRLGRWPVEQTAWRKRVVVKMRRRNIPCICRTKDQQGGSPLFFLGLALLLARW
jgi:hypothetical protein